MTLQTETINPEIEAKNRIAEHFEDQESDDDNPMVAKRNDVWRIAGDTMTRATAKYKPEIRESLRWFYEICGVENISMNQASKIVNLSSSTISKIYSGTYEGNPATLADAINSYRRIWNERQSVVTTGFTKTTISEKIFQICNLSLKYKSIGLIIGPSQVGKTTALLEYARLNNHGRTKFVRIPVSCGLHLLLKSIAKACRISPDASVLDLRARVKNALDENTLIIFDEVHQAFSTINKPTRMKIIEMIRELHDVTKCGMVLCATPIFEQEMSDGNLKELMEQLNRRCIYRIRIKDAVKMPDRDVLALAAPFGLKDIDDDSMEVVRTVLQFSGVGMFVRFLQAGKELAKNKKQPFAWRHFIETHDIVSKGWER